MKYYNYEDLSINSAKKPEHTHLIWEVSTSLIYMVDDAFPEVLLKSVDKGANWTTVETRTVRIASAFHDRANNKIYFVDAGSSFKAANQDFASWYITTTAGSENPTEMGAHNDANGYIVAWDIIKLGSDFFIMGTNYIDATHVRAGVWKWIDPNWVFQAGYSELNPTTKSFNAHSFVVSIDASTIYFWRDSTDDINFYKWVTGGTQTTLKVLGKVTYDPPTKIDQYGIAYDNSDKFYFVLKRLSDNKMILLNYSITAADITVLGEYNIALMLDRNAVSGVMEKAFHLTEYKVYQLHPYVKHQLYFIAKIPATTVIVAITDNFLICDDVGTNEFPFYERVDLSDKMTRVEFAHEIMNYSEGTLGVNRDAFTIEKGMFIQIIGKYTTEGVSSDKVIFEGIVVDFDGERLQKVWLESPAKKELLNVKPRGSFSGRSDEIMTSLLSTYCKYITKGTFSVGTAMGTITYAGDKSLMTILIEFALFEKWIWKLDPQGRLFFNDGTVDTLVDLSSSDKIWMVKTGEIREPYNYFYLKGALVSGVQLVKELEEADDLVSQQQFGYNPYEKTFASFNAQTILDQLTANVKARLKETPLVVEHWHYDASLGMLAIMETVTLVYDTTNVNVSSDQFLINRVLFKATKNAGGYTIADELV